MENSRLPLGVRLLAGVEFPHKLGILDRIYGRRLAKLGKQWVRTSNGKLWKLDLDDVNHRWIVYGIYEGSKWLSWLRKLPNQHGVVIESGANIGQTLLYYADWPGIKVFAFEPNPIAAAWLGECLSQNPSLSVEVVQLGLGGESADLELQVAGAQSTMIKDWYRGKDFARIKVQVVRLDDFANGHGIERNSFWKLDVEGFELEALHGASGLLETNSIDRLMIEAVGQSYLPIKKYLNTMGYKVYLLSSGGDLTDAPEHVDKFQNVIALPAGSGNSQYNADHLRNLFVESCSVFRLTGNWWPISQAQRLQ